MISTKIENKIIGKQYLGIEIFSTEDIEKINCVLTKKHADELLISDYFKFISIKNISLDKFSEIPVILTINTNKVLIKEFDSVEKNDSLLVKKAFSNLNLDDFYYDIWRFDDKSIISLVRKNYIDEIINSLQNEHKLAIGSVFIGISQIKNTIDYINQDIIILNGKKFDKKNSCVEFGFSQKKQNIYEISGMKIKGEDLTSFSGIISFLSSNLGNGSINELNTKIKYTFLQGKLFKFLSRITIFGLLFILLVNYLFFTRYFDKYQELTIKNQQEIMNLTKIEKLKKNVLEKEKKLKEIALSSSEKITVKVNEISKSIPKTILLEKFNFQPIEKKGNHETLALFKENIIEIKGITVNSDDFTNWIELLSKKKFIKEVTIVDFGKDENKDLLFTISISLNEIK